MGHTLTQLALITIPGGSMLLGEGDEVHSLNIATFQIGRFPVTTDQYHTFITATGYPPPHHWPDRTPYPHLADHPVVNISWFDALAFCQWLSEQEGRRYRLPTEAEWEKAARGEDGRIYPWGNTFYKENCNTWESGASYTLPVNALPQGASPFGVMDMAGNVWEWCSTILADYPYDAQDGREDLSDTEAWRVLRGGSWYDTDWGVRAARRFGSLAAYASHNTGFRLACSD